MDRHLFKKFIYINEISFFLGWTFILLLGADKPPPHGFIYVVLLIIFLDGIQYLYLKSFLPNLYKVTDKRLFFKNIIIFTIVGLVLGLLVLIINYNRLFGMGIFNILIWLFVLSLVGLLYSIWFYIFNSILIYFIK